MVLLALSLGALAYWMSWALDRIELAIVEKKHSAGAAKVNAPVPTTMQRLSPASWQGGRRFLRPSTDEEAFAQGPFEREYLAGAVEPGIPIPATSENPVVAALIQAGTNALHAFDEPRAQRCFRSAATVDPQCAGAWLGLAIASEREPGRGIYFLDKAEAATGKTPAELGWITAYRSFFAAAEAGDLAGRLSGLAGAFDSIASAQNQDPAARLFAIRYRILAHHLVDAALPDPSAMDALLGSLTNSAGKAQIASYGVLLWLKLDARRALPYAQQLFPNGAVTCRLAAAPREALKEWSPANELLSISLTKQVVDADDFENSRLLTWALFHQGNTEAAVKLATLLQKLPRRPLFGPERQPDVDPGDVFIEGRRLRAQLLMAAGKWEELARSDALTPLDEAGCQLAMVQTHYWRAIAFAAQGFSQNANNQLDRLREFAREISKKTSADRHAEMAEGMARGAEAFIELADGHVSPYVSDIADVPAVALAPFMFKAGDRVQAQQMLEKDLGNHPDSVPIAAMLQALKDGRPLEVATKRASELPSPNFSLAAPMPAPGFTLPDETGNAVGLEKWQGQPVLVIFQAGGARAEDAAPLKELRAHAPSFAHFGIPIVVITTEEATLLLEALGLTGTPSPELPFNMLSDRQQYAFKAWGCYDHFLEKPLHGAFLMDGQGSILWSSISHISCVQPEYLLLESQRLLTLWKEEAPPADKDSADAKPAGTDAASQKPADAPSTNSN